MRVLVAHGRGTDRIAGVASAIGCGLRARGYRVSVAPAPGIKRPSGFDAVVIGSEVCAGKWSDDCVRVLKHLAAADFSGPLWLFHLGEAGEDCRRFPPRAMVYADRLDVRDWVIIGDATKPDLDTFEPDALAALIASELVEDAAA